MVPSIFSRTIAIQVKFRKRVPVVEATLSLKIQRLLVTLVMMFEALPPYDLAKSKLVNFDLLGELRRAHADEVGGC